MKRPLNDSAKQASLQASYRYRKFLRKRQLYKQLQQQRGAAEVASAIAGRGSRPTRGRGAAGRAAGKAAGRARGRSSLFRKPLIGLS